MNWMVYGAMAAVALAAADVMVKLASGKLPSSLGMLLYGSVPFAIGLVWFASDKIRGVPMTIQPAGIGYGLGVGVGFALVTVGLYAAFNAGAPISTLSPVIRVGGLVLAAVTGILIWKETVTAQYLFGIALSLVGIYLMIKN